MRRRFARQVAGVQTVARRKLDVERHRRAKKMRAAWPALPPHIHVWSNDSSGRVHVVPVKAGAVILIFADDPKPSRGCAVSLPAARDARRRDSVLASKEIDLLPAKLDHHPCLPGMLFRDVRRDEIVHGAARAQAEKSGGKEEGKCGSLHEAFIGSAARLARI